MQGLTGCLYIYVTTVTTNIHTYIYRHHLP
nr:MAG TPA: hypothetical protein [Caudoviricetes sp.]